MRPELPASSAAGGWSCSGWTCRRWTSSTQDAGRSTTPWAGRGRDPRRTVARRRAGRAVRVGRPAAAARRRRRLAGAGGAAINVRRAVPVRGREALPPATALWLDSAPPSPSRGRLAKPLAHFTNPIVPSQSRNRCGHWSTGRWVLAPGR